MVQAQFLGVVQDLGEVLGEAVGVGVVVVVVVDMAADALETVVPGQPLELGQCDRARGPLGVSGELDLVVAEALKLLEDLGEADRGDLVTQ